MVSLHGIITWYPYMVITWCHVSTQLRLSVLIDAEPVVSTSCEAGGINDRFPETATALDGR